MYINTFKYTPKDVSCQLCTEYVKKLGCTALRCPWLAERIEAGVVGYREAVLETFPHERRLFQRLNLLIKHYPGSLWNNEQHERRMQYQCAVQGYRRRRDTNAYYAAMHLLTSNDDIYRRTANCFCKDGIEFGYERLRLFSPDRYSIRLHPGEGGITGIWDEVLERFCGDGEQTLRFAEQNNAIAYLDGIKRDMGIELSPPAFTTPLGYTYHIGDRISSIELDHIAAVGVIARVDEDHVWHTLPNVPGQEPVSIDRNSFERYLDTRYFEVSEPEPQRVIAAQHTEQPTPETPQAVQNLMGQRVEIDGKLYNVDSADETVAHLSVVSSSSESNHDPEHRTEPVSAVLTRIADQGRELAPNISAYQALRAEHPEKLIGVRVGERLLFYGADAERAASALNRRLLQRDIPGMGETAVTGYDFGQWASGAKRLLEHGHSFVFAQPNETDGYDVINEADAKEYIPIGMELEIDGRKFVIDSVNFGADEVSLRDVTFQNRQGFPIFRAEHIAFVRSFVEEQEQEQPQPIAKPVAFYPAEKTHLPYDIEIKTLHIPEPEHDPPSAEPAKPEPPAMSEEEALILEQEGRAALSEMGEFVPDSDDAISQAEINEPPAHRPAVSIPVDGEWQGFPSVAAAEQAAYADFKAASHRDAQNFHITDDALGVGGAKAKFRANMAAIHLLQELEFEGLQASPEQQEILSRYVGWGGLADAFDENKPNWSDEFAELYATLSPEEYAAARASTLNAHYTSPTVIKAIYEAVGNMGFQTGNILEPSMGVGNFFGLLPEQMQGSKLYGVELDSITGRIAKQLYPKADITIAGFETTDRKDFYDLAVGNVPFGQYQVDDRAYNKLGFSIHDYFFAKTLDQVRPGGVIAFVTSRYTMDKQSPEVRRYIAQRAELLGAIRLPNNAFRANAGTDVVSDMEPFNVIYQTAEDGLGDTVKPRLIEAGADLDRVLVIDDSEVQLTLSDERIEKAIIENNARLVIIDPIQAYLGADVDMNRANEVRPIFMRLGQVAQRTGCAILLIGHLNKAAGMQSLQRGLGSIDIAAAVRSVMFIGKLKHDPTMRILTHEKSSLAPPGASLAFSLGDEGGFRWVGEYDITADEMLSGIEPQRETKTQQAKDLICTLLAGGKQVLSEDIDKAALERGIPGRTVRDAKRELGDALKSKIVEGRKKVFWME